MPNLASRLVKDCLCSMLVVSICCGALLILLASCSANIPLQRKAQQTEESVLEVKYSIVCVIHGDGDYLYHDTSGNEYKADEEALAGAIKVAQQNPNAEVFIFHQKPKRHFLLLFPLQDGEFSYYRNGQLITNELYWRDSEQSHFEHEVELYHHFRVDSQREIVSMFLYYGHEIPEYGGAGYDASYPNRKFTIKDLTIGLEDFTRDSARFDLIILSTCFGGTPYTIGALGPFAKTIIASPENLHLSYFDLSSLARLELRMRDGDVPTFAKRFAHQAFDRLTTDIQTAVSVVVYDVDRVQEFLRSVHTIYTNKLTTLKGETPTFLVTIEHCDCAELPAYMLPTMQEGVDIFYRPAHFGRSKQKQNHSGWECWRDIIP
jgi:hypothetical protein